MEGGSGGKGREVSEVQPLVVSNRSIVVTKLVFQSLVLDGSLRPF
jgi:hypothetical protein